MLVAISFGWFYRLNDCDANDKFPGNKSVDSKAFKEFENRIKQIINSKIMFKNYFKIAWRNILKNRTFSIINAVGLSFSVAFCLLLYFYIRYEQSYDTFNTKKDHLFRLEMNSLHTSQDTTKKKSIFSFLPKSDNVQNQLTFPLVVAANMQNAFPEIKSITRFKDERDWVIKVDNQVYKEHHVLFADSDFFNNFSFHLLEGNAKNVLALPGNIVISASLAKKYFGNNPHSYRNAIGKTIELISDTAQLYVISGVAEDAPQNSSIQYSVIVPLLSDPGYRQNIDQGFNQQNHLYIVELADKINLKNFEEKLNKWVTNYYTKPFIAEYGKYFPDYNFKNFRWFLRPLADAHYNASDQWGHYTDANKMYQLACLVIIILLIAALNYVLLVISNAAARSQEIGVRKVLGATRISVVTQFWIETLIVTIIAVAIGFVLMRFLLPLFNSVMDVQIDFGSFSFVNVFFALLFLAFFLSFIAGLYPALILSKLRPVSIIKSFQTFRINPRFSKVIVIIQYTSCVVLMIAAFVINKQMKFVNNKDLGFDKDQVLIVNNPKWDLAYTKQLRERLQVFAQSQSAVHEFSGMNGGLDGAYNTNGFLLNGEQKWLKQLTVDYNYFDMLGIKVLKGRAFSKGFPSDTSADVRPCVVNETLFKLLGKDAKLGVYNEPLHATIIGMVKDYNFETLSKKIEPEQHMLARNYVGTFMFKVKAGAMQSVIASLQNQWKQIADNYPFEFSFLDQKIAKIYDADMRWQKIIQASCFFAIFIACMGLFGLSGINAANRTKEIGIRKVLGATVKNIVATLSSGFIALFLIAIVIAAPLAYWIMNNWLQDFAYRINISWIIFLMAGLTALSIALATVSIQAIKAAIANPVKSLRSE
jgi:putative ABC transport system permease protein